MRSAISPLLDGQTKGLPADLASIELEQVGRQGWNLLAEDLPLPLAILKDSALRHNAAWMRGFLRMTGMAIAPHGKTSMSPQLLARQLADGAWGISVATVQQLRVCRAGGINRVLLANQLVGKQGIAYVLDELARDTEFDFFALIDSVASAEALARAARARNPGRPLKLLIECGSAGGRAGCRSVAESIAVARAVAAAQPYLELAGVEGYEGAVPPAASGAQDDRIREFVGFMASVANALTQQDLLPSDPIILTAGGSAWFDLVSALPRALNGRPTRVVIRSGCYLTHDSDAYARGAVAMLERDPGIRALGPGLRDALEVWSYVQSLPEPGLAILTMGKRDVSHDLHLPYARWMCRPRSGAQPAQLPRGSAITALNDQHAFMRVPPELQLQVGDMIGCAISHPCTTFDKWRFLPIVDDRYNVVDAITTSF